jgi:hypothetical protein
VKTVLICSVLSSNLWFLTNGRVEQSFLIEIEIESSACRVLQNGSVLSHDELTNGARKEPKRTTRADERQHLKTKKEARRDEEKT